MTLRAVTGSAGLRAFRHRNYRLFYSGQLTSLIGTWMQSVAQGWLVLELTGDPFYLGLIAAAQFSPVLIFGLFGGIIADAVPKRQTMIVSQVAMMILAFIMWGLTASGVIEVWMILILALLLGLANAVDMPVRQAFGVEMVGREDVANAVALNSAMFNAARIIGPAIAGLIIGVAGIPVAFFLNGVTFIAVIGALVAMRDEELRLPPPSPRPRTTRAVVDSLAEGLGYVRRTPMILLAVTIIGVVGTFGMNFNVLIPAYAKDVLNVGAEGYGFLMSASGVGSLMGALWLAFSGRPGPARLLGGALLLGMAEVILAVVVNLPVALLLMLFVGTGGISMTATANTTIQMLAPDGLRGRAISVYTTVFAGSAPIGGLIVGAIASGLGVPAALLIGGGVSAIAVVTAALWLRTPRGRAVSRSLDDLDAIPLVVPPASPAAPVPQAPTAASAPADLVTTAEAEGS